MNSPQCAQRPGDDLLLAAHESRNELVQQGKGQPVEQTLAAWLTRNIVRKHAVDALYAGRQRAVTSPKTNGSTTSVNAFIPA